MSKYYLGISGYYHDSAAAIIVDGKIIAAAQEERFTRIKHDFSFPHNAIQYVLKESSLEYNELSAVIFYEKPFLKFERLLETYHALVPKGLANFLKAIPIWIKEKLFFKRMLYNELSIYGKNKVPILFSEHHLSHAASAFYPSPFENAAILTIDGVGEWATTTIGIGNKNKISIIKELKFPHSVGLLYSSFTQYLGFRVNSGEYKLMGLAPYGNPNSSQIEILKDKIKNKLVDIKEDGSIILNMDFFNFASGLKMINIKKWTKLFDMSPREPESEINTAHMNLAFAFQQITEEIILKLANAAKVITKEENIVLAGGVALNCVANSKILNKNIFKNIWIQPASGDAGGALGAALVGYYLHGQNKRNININEDSMNGAYLGPEYSDKDVLALIRKYKLEFEYFKDFNKLIELVARKISLGNVIGWFQGRMEFGPRALGNRSILGDARNPEMQKKVNLKIKFREGFRPFAPSVLEEDMNNYFEMSIPSPYMLFVAQLQQKRLNPLPQGYNSMSLYNKLYFNRSDLPAITHIDYSARIQSVNSKTNPRFWKLIKEFKKQTGYGVLLNTSFNVRGEPIVCNPEDAYRCFKNTEMDYLVIGNFYIYKN